MIEKKRLMIVLVLSLLLLNISVAEEPSANVLLTLKDINNNEYIDSVIVSISIDNNVINQFVEKGEILRINLNNGTHNTEFRVDNLLTNGKDYYGKDSLNVENSLIKGISLYPVGSIRGIVKDKLDNVVDNARLKFECSMAGLIDFPETTDKFGSFSVDYIPVGNCRISANYKRGVGFTYLNVEKGSLNNIEIRLDRSIVSSNQNYLWFIVLILIIAGIIIYRFREQIMLLIKKEKRLERIGKKEEKEIKELKAELKLGKRARDVLETLKDKEKEIVKFIVGKNGKTTQSKIYYGTGIPKVSLSRYIHSLEQKKIIEIKKIGKVNNIQFSEWFLGKEKMEQ